MVSRTFGPLGLRHASQGAVKEVVRDPSGLCNCNDDVVHGFGGYKVDASAWLGFHYPGAWMNKQSVRYCMKQHERLQAPLTFCLQAVNPISFYPAPEITAICGFAEGGLGERGSSFASQGFLSRQVF